MQATRPTTRTAPSLVVLDSQPAELARWLDPRTRGAIEIRGPSRGEPVKVDDLRDLASLRRRLAIQTADLSGALLELPMDGPPGAVRWAATAVRDLLGTAIEQIAVVAVAPGPSPTDPELVGLLAAQGLRLGIDLCSSSWLTHEGAWIAGHDRVSFLPVPWHERGSEVLAGLLSTMLPIVETAPTRAWLRAAAAGRGDQRVWSLVLRAIYVDCVVRRLPDATQSDDPVQQSSIRPFESLSQQEPLPE